MPLSIIEVFFNFGALIFVIIFHGLVASTFSKYEAIGKFYFIRMASTFSGIFNNMIRLNGNFDFERELDTIIGRLI